MFGKLLLTIPNIPQQSSSFEPLLFKIKVILNDKSLKWSEMSLILSLTSNQLLDLRKI